METTRTNDPEARSDTKRTATAARDEASKEAKQLAGDARREAREIAREASAEANRAAEGVIGSVADQLESFADDLRGENLESLFHRVESTARRNPALFFAGSVVAGLALARFAKSSARRRQRDDRQERLEETREARPDRLQGGLAPEPGPPPAPAMRTTRPHAPPSQQLPSAPRPGEPPTQASSSKEVK